MKSKINFFKNPNFSKLFNSKLSLFGKIIKPVSFAILVGAIYKNKNFLGCNKSYCEDSKSNFSKENNENTDNIFDSCKKFDSKFFTVNLDSDNNENSVIYILYNKENILQNELKDIINAKLKYYINSKNLYRKDNIKIQIIESSQKGLISKIKQSTLSNYLIESENADNIVNLKKKEANEKPTNLNENYILEKIDNLNNSNEPVVIIKSGLCLENINALSFVKDERITKNKNHYSNNKIDFSLHQKLDNLFLYYFCDEMTEIRDHFKFLDKAENKIVLLSAESFIKNTENSNNITFDYQKLKYLSLFKEKNTKIIFVNNEELSNKLKMENNILYTYYPPKIPNIMRNVELFLQENQLTQRYEGVDLNKLFNNSPINFILKFNFFRNEIKLNYESLNRNFNDAENYLNKENFNFNRFERMRMQKLFSYPKRQVRQLATTDRKLFKKTWNEKNKTVLFVWLPNWAFLKESLFNFILYDANHLFDEIQITNSKNFTLKNKLYDNSGISDDLPQLFIIETGDAEKNLNKKIYAFNYFRFSNELQNYMSNKHPIYKPQTSVDNLTNVKFLNTKTFKEKILDDKKLKEFIIEIKHEGCPSCFMLGKMFDQLSLKLKKHKLENKIKLFRIDTENDLRYLGDFAATPTYLFGKKNEKGEITFLSEIPKQEFIFRIKKYSNYDLTKIRYHPNLYFGFQVYQNKMFLKPDFDPDIDINSYV